jgi:hypothetical protein
LGQAPTGPGEEDGVGVGAGVTVPDGVGVGVVVEGGVGVGVAVVEVVVVKAEDGIRIGSVLPGVFQVSLS